MTTETGHKHMFPFEKPGVFGPCECGLTRERALASAPRRASRTEAEAVINDPDDDADWEAIAKTIGGRLVNRPLGDTGEYETLLVVPVLPGTPRLTTPGRRDLNADETRAEFTGWMEGKNYSTHPDDCEGMDEAFAAGMQAERDLAAMNATGTEDSRNQAVPVTAPMLAAAFRRLRVVTVHHDGMPFEHGPLAAAIIDGLAS